MNLRIDHVTVCGRDLDRMSRAFAAVGLAPEYGGVHANRLTHMALVGLEDGSYLELIAPLDPEQTGGATGMMSEWLPLMLGDAGTSAWAVQVDDIQEVASRLRARGIAVRGPEPGGRKKPDGAQLKWETALIGPGTAGSVLPFMIEDRTERILRVRASTAAREAGFRGVEAVVIGVQSLERARDLFEQAFGWHAAVVEEDLTIGVRLAKFSDTPVILAEAVDRNSRIRRRIERFGEGPVGFVLRADVEVRTTARWFGRRVGWFDEAKLEAWIGIVS
jgi:hypothetical protein